MHIREGALTILFAVSFLLVGFLRLARPTGFWPFHVSNRFNGLRVKRILIFCDFASALIFRVGVAVACALS